MKTALTCSQRVNETGSERLELTRTWIAVAILRSLDLSGIPSNVQEEPLNRKSLYLSFRLPGANLLQILSYEFYIGCARSRSKTSWMPQRSLFVLLC